MPHHQAAREVRPHELEPHYAHQRLDRARISACGAITFLASELAVILPTVPLNGNPYRALRGTRTKRETLYEEIYTPQALLDVLRRHGEAGRMAARALLDDPGSTANVRAPFLVGLTLSRRGSTIERKDP